MKLKNGDIIIDDNFPCSSAGEMRIIESGISEIGYKIEEIPQWFQDLLDELFDGAGVPNALGEVPKFGINHLVEGKSAPRETAALWQYLLDKKPDASIEVHAHFTRPDFTRSIGMHDKASMPRRLRAKAEILEQAIFENYHIEPLKNRKVLIDPRQPEHNVYGDKHICEQAGTIRTFLQAIPDSIDAHNADVKEMVETIAHALIKWRETGAA